MTSRQRHVSKSEAPLKCGCNGARADIRYDLIKILLTKIFTRDLRGVPTRVEAIRSRRVKKQGGAAIKPFAYGVSTISIVV